MIGRYCPEDSIPGLSSCVHNLNRLDRENAGLLDARRAHLRELARSLTADMPEYAVLYSRMTALLAKAEHAPDTIADNRVFMQAGFAQLSLLEQTELCRLVCAELQDSLTPEHFFAQNESAPPKAQGIIAYLQNVFTDRAYRIFADLLPRARSRYYESYSAACEAVANDASAAAILPVEHAQDGKLISFYRLIERYALKIAYTCTLSSPEGAPSRFALVQKDIALPPDDPEFSRYFEFSITRNAAFPLGRLIDAAQLCGFALRRIDSLPLSYEGEGFAYHLILSLAHGVQLTPFLLFLALRLPQYNPIGIYSHIPEYE